jgi:hypothetical protein
MKFNRICKGAYKTEINGKKVLIQNTYESNGMGRTLWDIIIENKIITKDEDGNDFTTYKDCKEFLIKRGVK